MSEQTEEIQPVFENEMFEIITGMSERLAGPKDADGNYEQYLCYQLINKNTRMMEKEGFILVELVELAVYSTMAINRADSINTDAPEDADNTPNNILTLQ